MANKITCPNCGHSWDKSTSTAKDAHVCHICGKGNVNMKNGGWLDKYEAPEAQNGKELTPKEFTLQYINSPKYRERLTKSEYGDIDAEIKRRYDNVKNTNNIITQSGPSGVLDSFKGFVFNEPYNPTGGSNASSKNTIFYDPTEAKKIGSTKDETLSHEFSHKETMGDNDGTIFLNNRDIKELTGRLNPGAKKTMHDARADENKADMNAVRYWLYNNGVDVFNKDLTPEDLKKAKASGKFTSNRLFKNYKSDEDLLWLLNNVAKNKSNQEVRIAQNGIEGTMGGLTDVGFNYNGAWGGPSMAMGGSLPGSVGFTYARIQGSAPANGKYTKKTKASAQNGAEMSFYQNGLDWKPRNISRDGAWLDKYDVPQAQSGEKLTFEDLVKGTKIKPTSDNTKVVVPEKDRRTLTEYLTDKSKESVVTNAKPKRSVASKALAMAVNPMTALSYKVKGQDIPENFERGDRNILDYAMDIINPAGIAESISSIPKNISEGEYSQAGLNLLSVLPFGMDAAKNPIIKKASSIVRDVPRAESIKEAIGRVAGVPLKKDLPRMATQDVTSLRKVQELGRMRDLNKSTSEQMKYALDNNLPEEHFNKFFRKSREEAQNLLNTGYQEQEAARSADIRSRLNLERPSRRPQAIDMAPDELTQQELTRGQQNLLDALFGEEEIADLIDLDEIDQLEGFGEDIINPPTQNTAGRLSEAELRARFRQLDAEEAVSVSPIASGSNRDLMISEILDARSRGARPNEETMRQILTPEQFAAAERNSGGRSIPLSELSIDQLDELRNYTLSLDADDVSRIPTNFGNTLMTKGKDVVRGINQGVRSIDKKLENILINTIQDYPYYSGEIQQKVPGLFLQGKGNLKDVSKTVGFAPEGIKSGQVFTGSTNTSHSSYLPQLKQVFKYNSGQPQFLGYKSMNSLGYLSRAGYDEKDIAAYLNSEIDEQVKRGVIPKNIQRPFQQGESVILPQYGVRQYKKGGIVKDDNGYWNPDNWGEPVEIGSNNITMQGVNQPLIGVSDKGDVQYMEPGKDYKFKGKKVTEYPIKKNGGWLEKYK